MNSEFSFILTGCPAKVKERNLPYYLHIAEERTDGFMPFPIILEQSERQTASSRIWTLVTNSKYNDTKHTLLYFSNKKVLSNVPPTEGERNKWYWLTNKTRC